MSEADTNIFTDSEVYALIIPENTASYGGAATSAVYRAVKGINVDTVVIISPSRSGSDDRITISHASHITTAGGEIRINDLIREELCDEDDDIFLDDLGHHDALGILTQLPYLQSALGQFDLVPIVLQSSDIDLCLELGHALGEIMYNRRVLLVAIVDFRNGTSNQLEEVASAMKNLDVETAIRTINRHRLDLHGRGPFLASLIAAKNRGATRTDVLYLQPATTKDPGVVGAVVHRA